jgi:hypothetical protein
MHVAEAGRTLAREFIRLASEADVPPLAETFAEFVKTGHEAAPDDYRLVPLTPPCLRLLMTSSDCLTDCMFELQSRYQQFIPSDWGGHMEKGWRDLAVVGFNIEPGPVLDILELEPTTGFPEWAQPKLDALDWQRLLIRAVVDFGRACHAQQVYASDENARALGFDYDHDSRRWTMALGAS